MGLRKLATAAMLLPGLACGGEEAPSPGSSSGSWESPIVRLEPDFILGGAAPDFALPVLPADGSTQSPGDTVRLSDHLGHVIVLDFWNTGCKPCVAEHATLGEIAEAFRSRGVRFFGITDFDTPASLARFADLHGPFSYPNLSDRPQSAKRAYRILGWPTKVVIDSAGNVAWWRPGGPIERHVLTGVIEDVLADRRPDAPTSAAYPSS
jgi:thiol-disulfide isomerase/thioredoxin